MDQVISPKYLMKLVVQIDKAIWSEFSSYKNVRYYIDKWHIEHSDWNNSWENFPIIKKDTGEIDLVSTLHGVDSETLLKIAIDLGVETPDFIPCVPMFKNELKDDFSTAFSSFQKALKQVNEHPDLAIGLANSTLESILKEILKDDRLNTKYDKKKTTYQLSTEVLKEFKLYPEVSMPEEIKIIGSSLLSISQHIEKIRSEKTVFHGKTQSEVVIDDPSYAYFIINSVSTIGLFFNSFYKKYYPKQSIIEQTEAIDDLPF